MKEQQTAEEVLSEVTGIPVYRIKCDDKGEFITKKGALQAMKIFASTTTPSPVSDEDIEREAIKLASLFPESSAAFKDAFIQGYKQALRDLPKKSKDGKCEICEEQTNSFHGNPAKWAIELEYVGGNGARKIYHRNCVIKSIQKRQEREWISVKDRLPELHKTSHLATMSDFVMVGYNIYGRYCYDRKEWFCNGFIKGSIKMAVTQWQPLPPTKQ